LEKNISEVLEQTAKVL